MVLQVRKVTLWRGKVKDRPGALAEVLALAARVDLEVVMGYVEHGGKSEAVIEVFPVVGRKLRTAATRAGLRPSPTPTLLVTGPNRAGVGHAVARALGEARVSVAFLVALSAGREYSALFGFASESDARTAARLIRRMDQR